MPALHLARDTIQALQTGQPSADPPMVGNPDASDDLYGVGVRIGIYLQTLGMNIYSCGSYEDGDTNDYRKGLKIASGSIVISILASWYVFAACRTFSASEAIITLLMTLSFPGRATLLFPRTIAGETIGLVTLLVVTLSRSGAFIWTFAVLVDILPLMGTDDVVFFFTEVPIRGWFRILALALCIIDSVSSLLFAHKVVRITAIAWRCYREGRAEATECEIIKIKKILKWEKSKTYASILNWLMWVLVIVSVELTLQWNHLTPSTDISAPGQIIPFVTGIVILIDSGFVVGWWAAANFARCSRPFDGHVGVDEKVKVTPATAIVEMKLAFGAKIIRDVAGWLRCGTVIGTIIIARPCWILSVEL
ncbi:hypothetical protein F4777DRAFT_578714 [Nemania sp. FL0916]|nr:hypothetical protein F4777DRAFT_578714 [Nemania sp. FL0916]